MTIALSHGGPTIYSSPSPSSQVLVGTIEGVVILERERVGDPWHIAHRGLVHKHIHALMVEPTSGIIFAGATKGSVHTSLDGGYTWELRDRGLTQDDIYSLSWSRHDGGVRIFAGTEPAHLFCTDDLGLTWNEMPAMRSVDMSGWCFPAPPHIAHTKHINFHPSEPETMFVSIEQGGLLKSTDFGESFDVVRGMDDDVHRTLISPDDPDRIYVTGGDGIYVTSDGGGSWEHWNTRQDPIGGYPDVMVMHPRQPETMFVGASRENPGGWRATHYAGSKISRTSDGGRTWSTVTSGVPDDMQSAFEAMSLEDWGDGFSLFSATAAGEMWCSDDGGDSWYCAASDLPPISKGDHYKYLILA